MERYELIEYHAQRLPGDRDFSLFYQLLERSFSKSEIRDRETQRRLFENGCYKAYVLKDAERVAALMTVWSLGDFEYVEHLAVDPALRGGGIGAQLLDFLTGRSQNPVILEAETPHDELSGRRIGFYERRGFVCNRPVFMQPALQPGQPDVPLHILSYPEGIDENRFSHITGQLLRSVYFGNH